MGYMHDFFGIQISLNSLYEYLRVCRRGLLKQIAINFGFSRANLFIFNVSRVHLVMIF